VKRLPIRCPACGEGRGMIQVWASMSSGFGFKVVANNSEDVIRVGVLVTLWLGLDGDEGARADFVISVGFDDDDFSVRELLEE
jgi:hypothetical protein